MIQIIKCYYTLNKKMYKVNDNNNDASARKVEGMIIVMVVLLIVMINWLILK